jgi:single-stranded-DNA-specific exonuclease
MQSLHPVIGRLLNKRGLNSKQIEEFFSWDLNHLPDLKSLKDLKKTSERIIYAIENNQKIGIYGDYDVDGTTSCALFYHFFKMLNIEVDLVQPSRFVEGYGLHLSSIDDAINKNISVLITVDCGITNNEAADYALLKNLDLIITDHHKDARDEMPKAYSVVNPNRRDEENLEMKSLAGVGVAFAVCMQVREDLIKKGKVVPSLYPLLQFVAIGTICDLAFLNPMNLKLVRHGLKQIKETKYPGLRVFFTSDELKAPIIPADKLAFSIGPLINSKGRLEHPEMALKLLITDNLEEARFFYDHLTNCNNERKFIQKTVFDEAKEIVKDELESLKSFEEYTVSIVYKPDWHEGVIGIVASKLVETFKVPAMVFTNSEHDGIIKASIRSAGELDIFSLLKKAEHFFIKFGGHKAAAGLSMKKENLKPFEQFIKNELKNIPTITRTRSDYYDLELMPFEINPALMQDLQKLEPFGMGNERPLFKIKGVKLDSFDLMKDVHVRWNLSSEKVKMKGISFNYIGKYNTLLPSEIFSHQERLMHKNENSDLAVICTLSVNRFNGNESIQLMVERMDLGT